MDTLSNDLSEIILAYLPDSTLLSMLKDPQLRYRIKDIYNSNTFWKRKVENKLGYDIDMYSSNWKDIYENINEDLNKSFRGAAENGRTDVVKLGMRSIPIYDHF